MIMDDGEIIREYQAAADKKKQVQVLADLNCVSTAHMAVWLSDHGQKVDKRYLPKASALQQAPAAPDPDQRAKADAGKPRLTLVPMQILFDIAEIREYGNRKYPDGGPDNWKKVEPERYREAAFRHFLRYINDPAGVDEESGLPHRWHLECNLAFLAELERGKKNE